MLKMIKQVKLKNKKGQSTVEYIILVTAILAALIAFLSAQNGPFQRAFNETLYSGTNGMQNMADRLAVSRPLSP